MNSAVMFLEDSVRFIFLHACKISVSGGVSVLPPFHSLGIGEKTKQKKITNNLEKPASKTSFCVDGSQQIFWHPLSTPQL